MYLGWRCEPGEITQLIQKNKLQLYNYEAVSYVIFHLPVSIFELNKKLKKKKEIEVSEGPAD